MYLVLKITLEGKYTEILATYLRKLEHTGMKYLAHFHEASKDSESSSH